MFIIPRYFDSVLISIGYVGSMIGYEIVNSVSGLFPEEQKRLNITKEEVRQTVLHSVTRARDYLCEIDPAIRTDRLDVKFSIIIEKPSDEVVFAVISAFILAPPYIGSHSADDEVSISAYNL